MKGLTTNEAAFLFCVIGEPGGIYPTVDEAIRYFHPPKYPKRKKEDLSPLNIKFIKEEEKTEQLSLLSMFG